MKRFIASLVVVLIIGLVAILPAFAGAQSVRYRIPFYLYFPEEEDPCTGHDTEATIAGTFDVHDVLDDAYSLIHSTWNFRGELTVVDKETGQVTSGPVNWNFSYDGSSSGPHTETYHAHIVSPGPGNNLLLESVWHASPNGVTNPDNVQLNHVCLDKPGN